MQDGLADIAALTDPEDGLLSGRLWPLSQARVPGRLTLAGDRLYYQHDALDGRDPAGALDAFIRIRGGADVLRFAQRYGVLSLCVHGLPASHYRVPLPGTAATAAWCPRPGGPEDVFEPIERWLHYARQAGAIVRVASALQNGELGTVDDWLALDPDLLPPNAVGDSCRRVAGRVNTWLRLASVQPGLHWEDPQRRAEIRWVGGGTFGILAAQLLLATSHSHSLATCTGCGSPYVRRQRAPQRGKGNFCAACGPTVAARLRKRRQRARDDSSGDSHADSHADSNPHT